MFAVPVQNCDPQEHCRRTCKRLLQRRLGCQSRRRFCLENRSGNLQSVAPHSLERFQRKGFHSQVIDFFGRSERIRTSDPCLPKTVLYQAELHSDRGGVVSLRP